MMILDVLTIIPDEAATAIDHQEAAVEGIEGLDHIRHKNSFNVIEPAFHF